MRFANIALCVVACGLWQCGKKESPSLAAPAAATSTNPNQPTQTPVLAAGPFFRGRVDRHDPAGPYLAWPNTAVALTFTGSSLAVTLSDQQGAANNVPCDSLFDVIIDQNAPTVLTLEPNSKTYPLAANLGPGPHTAWLIRRTEANTGLTQFLGFQLAPEGNVLSPPTVSTRRIEFVGDSEFPGYGNEAAVTSQDMCLFSAATENADYSIPKLTSDLLQADFMNISFSGKGVTTNLDPQDTQTLPLLYGRALPNDQSSSWDFSGWLADVVVVDAGGNDLQGSPTDPTSAHLANPAGFVQTYVTFLASIRQRYPKAHIFCVLTSAAQAQERTVLSGAIQQAIAQATAAGDTQVSYFDYFANDPTNQSYGDAATNENLAYGCDYHPSRAGSEFLAARLAAAIKQTMAW